MADVMKEVHLTSIKPKNNVLLLAQEISFAKVLACNDKRLRDRGVRRLKKWFLARSQGTLELTKEDLMRIWKGLFYCMWMSDKPLIQEELAEEISRLVHSFATFKSSLLFVETFFSSLSVEWFGLDQLRMDKFMMLVRRCLRQSLELVAKLKWAEPQVQQLVDVYERTLTAAPMGLSMHLIEIFCEELAKVGKGELSSETILQFIAPFARIMAGLKDGRLISQITRYVFLHLMRQSELGIEYQMKFNVWKEYGFPGGDVDAAEKIEDEEEEPPHSDDELMMRDSDEGEGEEDERLVGPDARAGKVDVMLPPLDFDPQQLLRILVELRNKKDTTTKARKTLIQLISKYENFAGGKYPLGLHKVELPVKEDKKKQIIQAAKKLIIDEHQMIYSDTEDSENNSSKQKKRNKKKEKTKSEKQSVWEVSDSDKSPSLNEAGLNSSWDVSDAVNKEIQKSKNVKKRKIAEENTSTVITPVKKVKVSPFSVSGSKENSFSSPVASTPKNGNKNNILKKSSSNSQNVSNNKSTTSSQEGSVNQQRKKARQKNRRKSNKNVSLDGSAFDSRNENSKLVQEESNDKSSLVSDSNTPDNTIEASDIQLNTTASENNNGWGGEWDEQPKDVEYEIFIPNKKYVEKRKSLGLSYPVPSFFQKAAEKVTPVNRLKGKNKSTSSTPGSQKKVEFDLRANCSQEYKDYTQKVKRSKSQVPFDADKKPIQGLLKNSTPSPINPFYMKKLKLFSSKSKS